MIYRGFRIWFSGSMDKNIEYLLDCFSFYFLLLSRNGSKQLSPIRNMCSEGIRHPWLAAASAWMWRAEPTWGFLHGTTLTTLHNPIYPATGLG